MRTSKNRIINWLQASSTVETALQIYCFQYWNRVLSGYIYEMVESSLGRHSVRSHMVLDMKKRQGKQVYLP